LLPEDGETLLTAASTAFAWKAGLWFRRALLLMVSPVRGDYRRFPFSDGLSPTNCRDFE
jgi:hypothetical protein